MSHCLFIHDFFQDGRLDVLAEVHVLQAYGQWTKEKRAYWTKLAQACCERFKHRHFSQTASYYAGRLAGLKSRVTAGYPPLRQERYGKTVFVALANARSVFCGSCGDRAVWKYSPDGGLSSIRYRCDRCKQEVVRAKTAYSALSGWDWDDDETELLPVQPGKKLVVREGFSSLNGKDARAGFGLLTRLFGLFS